MKNLLLFSLSAHVWAATFTVCTGGGGCLSSINAAIAAATCGDTIVIKASGGGGTGSNGSPAGAVCGGDGSCNTNNPIKLAYKNCTGAITITTDQASKLPAAGTRITPSYADGATRVVPLIWNSAFGPTVTADVGNSACGGGINPSCPAHDYTLIGLEFGGGSYGYQNMIAIGETPNGSVEPLIKTIADLPANIVFDRVLVRASPLLNSRVCIVADGNPVVIENSWIECGFDQNASDAVGIGGFNPQNMKIFNNYVSGVTETIGFGGACSPIHLPKSDDCSASTSGAQTMNAEISYNEITKPAWARNLAWTAATHFPAGQIIHPTGGSSPILQAQNGGISGGVEPAWPVNTIGLTIADGGILWGVVGASVQVKNLIEFKAGDGIWIHHNFEHVAYAQGQQGQAEVFTTRTNNGAGGGTWSFLNNVVSENNFLTDVGAVFNTSGFDDQDINVYASVMGTIAEPYVITSGNDQLLISVNGGGNQAITLTHGAARTAAQVAAEIHAALSPGEGCSEDARVIIRAVLASGITCIGYGGAGAGAKSILRLSAVANSAYATLGLSPGTTTSCTNPRTGVWYGCGHFTNYAVRNNLWTRTYLPPNLPQAAEVAGLFNKINGVQINNNTLDGGATGGGVILLANYDTNELALPNTNVVIRSNILGQKSATQVFFALGLGSTVNAFDFSAINYMMCNVAVTNLVVAVDSPVCPPGTFSQNIIPGAPLHAGTTMNTTPFANDIGFQQYPSDNYNPLFSSLTFVKTADSDYALTPGSTYQGKSTFDGQSIGANMSQIPQIKRLNVTASDRAAVFTWILSAPSAATSPCALRISANIDLTSPIADMDPSLFLTPDTSANAHFPFDPNNLSSQQMVVGLNAALTAGTKYYYYLGCAGASATGSFVTTASVSGTGPARFSVAPQIAGTSNIVAVYGTAFSRVGGIASATTTAPVACTVGQSCSVSLTATKGVPTFVQIRYRDASNNVLYAAPVGTTLITR